MIAEAVTPYPCAVDVLATVAETQRLLDGPIPETTLQLAQTLTALYHQIEQQAAAVQAGCDEVSRLAAELLTIEAAAAVPEPAATDEPALRPAWTTYTIHDGQRMTPRYRGRPRLTPAMACAAIIALGLGAQVLLEGWR